MYGRVLEYPPRGARGSGKLSKITPRNHVGGARGIRSGAICCRAYTQDPSTVLTVSLRCCSMMRPSSATTAWETPHSVSRGHSAVHSASPHCRPFALRGRFESCRCQRERARLALRYTPRVPIISTRILGRRTAPLSPFRITHRVPRGFTPRSWYCAGLALRYTPRRVFSASRI